MTQIDTPGGKQKTTVINESGLYSLLFLMKPAKARDVDPAYVAEREKRLKSFRRWVTHEVLPSIRKTGVYITDEVLERLREDERYIDELLNRLLNEEDKNSMLTGRVEEMYPKVRYCDTVLLCSDAIQTSVIAKDYGMSCVAFNKLLNGLKVQYKVGNTWLLYQNYSGKGYTVSRTYYADYNGSQVHTHWTQKGRRFLYDLLKWYGILPTAERFDCGEERR